LVSYVDANQRYQFINRTYEVWFSRSQDETETLEMARIARLWAQMGDETLGPPEILPSLATRT